MRKSAAALLFALLILAPCRSYAGVFVSVAVAPPPLVEYEQPLLPGPGYIWTPGYWAYDDDGWFWVPGAWVLPPEPELLWTPGYWEYDDYGSAYLWHAGYWGPTVGFYGGVPYGFGYTGFGYYGGYWHHGAFFYNSSCNHFDRTIIHNSYEKTVIINKTVVKNVSFNGGPGREKLKPSGAELLAVKERHVAATDIQTKHQTLASTTKETHFAVNHGKPAVAATAKPAEFSAKNVVPAHGAGTSHGLDAKNTNVDAKGAGAGKALTGNGNGGAAGAGNNGGGAKNAFADPKAGAAGLRNGAADGKGGQGAGNNGLPKTGSQALGAQTGAVDKNGPANPTVRSFGPNGQRVAHGEASDLRGSLRSDDPRVLRAQKFGGRPDLRANGGQRARFNMPGRQQGAPGFAAQARQQQFATGGGGRRQLQQQPQRQVRDPRFQQ
jgi:hypothetical protein